MKLRQPTDFLIPEVLAEHGWNVAPNLAERTGKTRANINTRLPVLADYGLVRKVGPAERSGLYELTDRGPIAIAHRGAYETPDDFEQLIEDAAESTTPGTSDG